MPTSPPPSPLGRIPHPDPVAARPETVGELIDPGREVRVMDGQVELPFGSQPGTYPHNAEH